MFKYICYEVTNTINGKFYIGVHKTKNLNDGYLGSGTNIKNAIKKYGKDNFERKILKTFKNSKDMYEFEKTVVNEFFLLNKDVYNIAVGGNGGWCYVNANYPLEKRIENIKLYNPGKWNDLEKRRAIWRKVPLEKRKKIAKSMGDKYGGQNKLTLSQINQRLDLIKEINLTKYGWVNKAATALKLTHTQTRRFIDKYYKGEIFKRK